MKNKIRDRRNMAICADIVVQDAKNKIEKIRRNKKMSPDDAQTVSRLLQTMRDFSNEVARQLFLERIHGRAVMIIR